MGKWIRSMVPLAIGLVAFGIAVMWLLGQNRTLGLWLLAGFLLGHGLVHLLFVARGPSPKSADAPEWPFDMAKSWLVTRAGLRVATVRRVGMILVVIVVISFALTALATVGLLIPSDGWQVRITGATAASLLLLALFLNPSLILGIGIDGVLLWVAAGRVWAP